jgi:pyruvate dehydrogenase E1 component alpha subunit
MVQLLTPEGTRVDHPDFSFDGSNDEIRALYRDLALVRRLDIEGTALQRHGELGLWPPLLGQEAAQIGAGHALSPQDIVFPTYREHGVAWVRGLDPLHVLSLFRGVDYGSWTLEATGVAPYTVVIGSQTLHATGYAMGVQRDGLVGNHDPERDMAVLVHLGDGATSQGDVNEAFVFAASYQAPVVFFCSNNHWAISEPTERQSRIPLHQRADGFGFPGIRVDGNDVLAVKAVTEAALQRAREGGGPTLIEAFTYRMGAHTTTDDPTRYRTSAEVESWKARDPLARVEAYLRNNDLADDAFFTSLAAEADALGERMREGCKALPDPNPLDHFDRVFVETTPELIEQRDAYAAFLATFEEVA